MLFLLFIFCCCFVFLLWWVPSSLPLVSASSPTLGPLPQPSVGVGSVEPTTLHVFHSVLLVPCFPVWKLGSDSSPPALPETFPFLLSWYDFQNVEVLSWLLLVYILLYRMLVMFVSVESSSSSSFWKSICECLWLYFINNLETTLLGFVVVGVGSIF